MSLRRWRRQPFAMATSAQVSLFNIQQCNSAPSILTFGTTQITPLDDICDILSIIKSTTKRLSPQNAHWSLKSTHQGLDFASSKLVSFQDALKELPSTAWLDKDIAHAFYGVCDALLDVVRAVEQAPVAIAHAATIKHPLRDTWVFLKSFGPLPCERQQHLRKIYCSTLNVVIKVQVSLDTLFSFSQFTLSKNYLCHALPLLDIRSLKFLAFIVYLL
jgi:hypothetical protein